MNESEDGDNTSILEEAERITRNGQRRQDYGSPLVSHERIAKLWTDILDFPVTAEQVALCMIGLKIARYKNGGTRDSLVDIAGYANCLDMMAEERMGRDTDITI